MGCIRCAECRAGMKWNESVLREAEESDQEGEGIDTPQGWSHGHVERVMGWDEL